MDPLKYFEAVFDSLVDAIEDQQKTIERLKSDSTSTSREIAQQNTRIEDCEEKVVPNLKKKLEDCESEKRIIRRNELDTIDKLNEEIEKKTKHEKILEIASKDVALRSKQLRELEQETTSTIERLNSEKEILQEQIRDCQTKVTSQKKSTEISFGLDTFLWDQIASMHQTAGGGKDVLAFIYRSG